MLHVKHFAGILSISCAIACSASFFQAKKFRNENEKFEFTADARFDPKPKWVSIAWKPDQDAPFLKIRREIQDAYDIMSLPDKSGTWAKRAKSSYDEYYNDYQNPVKLYKASAFLGTARIVDPKFAATDEFDRMRGNLNRGWSYLNDPPQSYEFARRGYTYNAGDGDSHIYGDLPFRLLKRDPNDRAVATAMVWQYYEDIAKTKNGQFESLMLKSLERVSKLKPWRSGDEFSYASALWLYGKRHKDASIIKKGLAKVRSAINMLPEGYSSKAKTYEQAYKEYEADLKHVEGK